MNRFIKDNKLVIPENEIDNIYIWTRVSNTQEVLLSAEKYFNNMKYAFERDTARVISTLNAKLPNINANSYTFSDYLTFTANKSLIFSNKACFAYMTNVELLHSLACYLAHTMNLYSPESDTLSNLIINKINEPERFTKLMDAEFIITKDYAPLPEHKYKQPILDMLVTRRCKPNLSTLVYVLNTGFIIGKDLIPKERAQDCRFIDLTPLVPAFMKRRKASYQSIMKTWLELTQMKVDYLVYSKSQPKDTVRQAR